MINVRALIPDTRRPCNRLLRFRRRCPDRSLNRIDSLWPNYSCKTTRIIINEFSRRRTRAHTNESFGTFKSSTFLAPFDFSIRCSKRGRWSFRKPRRVDWSPTFNLHIGIKPFIFWVRRMIYLYNILIGCIIWLLFIEKSTISKQNFLKKE